ncbi:MAG TPA: carbamate kinase [Candidatus Poseidoniales archaeon]|nr:MAG TPA: carbamate kinase [Candidatus Poseidoniales archaeon]
MRTTGSLDPTLQFHDLVVVVSRLHITNPNCLHHLRTCSWVSHCLIQCHPPTANTNRWSNTGIDCSIWDKPQTTAGSSHAVAKVAVYAIGGNALSSPTGDDEGQSEQVLAHVMSDVVDLLEAGWGVVLTHGNGPQVGHLMALDQHLTQPMDAWVAATQGMIGHGLALNLDSILSKRQRPERTATIVTRVLVDRRDPGFKRPTKPVGPVLSSKTVMEADWDIAETKVGPRRVVASPLPVEIIDLPVIQKLVDLHAVVICGGGGGIPVVRKDQHFIGVPAVIDKDRVSALLAIKLQADALIISTAIDAVRTGFGTDKEQVHRVLNLDECELHLQAGEFPAGSMGPKIGSLMEAALHQPGLQAILCQPGDAIDALRGNAGTTIVV